MHWRTIITCLLLTSTPFAFRAPAKAEGEFDLQKRKAEHWAWNPLGVPEAPAGEEIDYYVETKREAAGLKGSPEADRRTLIRRLHYDLIGLPPGPKEIHAFLADDRNDAYERLVDRLLVSKHFGEKWARHWMDLVRYCESYGHEKDYNLYNAYPYRDYLIRAFNQDVPYDQFVREHIAGDLLANPRRNPKGMNESIIGTAFFYFGENVHGPTDVNEDEAIRIENQIGVLGKTFLGMTVGCARCHDHKFDPIRMKDYYSLSSFMQSTRLQHAQLDPTGEIKKSIDQLHELGEKIRKSSRKPRNIELFDRYLSAAGEVLTIDAGQKRSEATPAGSEDLVFENFEGGLEKWILHGGHYGDAFDSSPVSGSAHGQAPVTGFLGKKLLNTFHDQGDGLRGMVRSKSFVIQHDYIHFLIGGGNRKDVEYLALRIEDEAEVFRSTGRDDEQLRPESWNVSSHKGKSATLEIADDYHGSQGHILLDHIVFSDRESFDLSVDPAAVMLSDEVLRGVATKRNLNMDLLQRWVVALNREHPLTAWREPFDPQEDFSGEASDHAVTSWEGNMDPGDWYTTGFAFDARFEDSQVIGQDNTEYLEENVISSRRISTRLKGTARTRDFVLTESGVAFLVRAEAARVRLIIENYQIEPFNRLLFLGTSIRMDTGGECRLLRFDLKKIPITLVKYAGRTCYLEFNDESDGYFDVLGIDFTGKGDFKKQQVSGLDGENIHSLRTLIAEISKYWQKTIQARQDGNADSAQHQLINWVEANGLLAVDGIEALARYEEIVQQLPYPLRSIAATDGTAYVDYVHVRGSYKSRGEETPRRFLEIFTGEDPDPIRGNGSGRLALAQQLVESNPLVSRVLVNRLWHHLFGRGIVATVDDFGLMGQMPSHPELLDWLARDFMENGWSIKQVIKKMVVSRTYRQSSKKTNRMAELEDPENVYLHRMRLRRLTCEQIRDGLLAISSRLDDRLYGPGVPVYFPIPNPGRGQIESGPVDGEGRRSIYLEVRRNFLPPMMLTFDFPAPFNSIGRRTVSNVPAQALVMMNNPLVHQMTELWAKKLMSSGLSGEELITNIFEAAVGHPPCPEQMAVAREFLSAGEAADNIKDLCHTVFNMKSFVYLN